MSYNKYWTKEKQKKYWKKYHKKNFKKLRKKQLQRYNKKYKSDPDFRKKAMQRAYEYYHRIGKHKRLKLRFEILKRFNFTCQYCGRKAPDVILHIDHIIPLSATGKNENKNLTVSCSECNMGKSDILLNK